MLLPWVSILAGLGVVGDRVPGVWLGDGVTGLTACCEGCLDRFSERACSSASPSSGRSRVLSSSSYSGSVVYRWVLLGDATKCYGSTIYIAQQATIYLLSVLALRSTCSLMNKNSTTPSIG